MTPKRRLLLFSGGFTPLSLFSVGEQGGVYDPTDFSTLFQDSAGTTPVTAAGQPVGKILDKSGRGNHRTQATAASRPTLQQDASGYYYLSYDGVDDGMATASVNFSGTNKVTVWAGLNKQSDAAFASIIELSTNTDLTNGAFCIGCGTTTGDAGRRTWAGVLTGTTPGLLAGAAVFASPDAKVISMAFDTAAVLNSDQIKLRLNGSAQSMTYGAATAAGNFSANPMYFGRRSGSSNPFNGREYATIILGRSATNREIAQAERWVGLRMGIAL